MRTDTEKQVLKNLRDAAKAHHNFDGIRADCPVCAAKAAAEAHYRERLQSALVPVPEQEPKETLPPGSSGDELERLRAIVAKLPVTADGVPIHPQMLVWHPDQIGEGGLGVWTEDGTFMTDVPTRLGRDNFVDRSESVCAAECYSTRAAALAAKTKNRE